MRQKGTLAISAFMIALISVLSTLIVVLAPRMANAKSEPQTPSELWFSWSSEAKQEYVRGYLSGFLEGKRAGCAFYAEKILPYTPHKAVPPEELPQQACLSALPDFKEPYFTKYVDTITDYYKKFPNDPQAGVSRILLESATPPGLTIDQIHEKLTR